MLKFNSGTGFSTGNFWKILEDFFFKITVRRTSSDNISITNVVWDLCKIKIGAYLLGFYLILPNVNKPRYLHLSLKKLIYYAIYKCCLVEKEIYLIIIPSFTRNNTKVSFQVAQNGHKIVMMMIDPSLYWLSNSKSWSLF